MTSSYIDRVRENRSSGAVLKAKLSNLRARNQGIAILVFEGIDDIGPYGAWISRIDDALRYEPLAASGKDQVLNLRSRLLSDRGGLAEGVYLFVDRDFDELKGQTPAGDIFCTQAYSVENYLVGAEVLTRLLADEFRSTAESGDREKVLPIFDSVLRQFHEAIVGPNRRIFYGTRLRIRGKGISDQINRYVCISLLEVKPAHTEGALASLIPLQREPNADECRVLEVEFEALAPYRYRGKFVLDFFMRWLELLAAERKSAANEIFSARVDTKFSSQKLTMGWLASRSDIPPGLHDFVTSIATTMKRYSG